jgi:hypothetical protein
MHLLPFRIGLGNLGAWLAQPKAQLPKQALALPYPQVNLVPLRNPSRKGLAVPQISTQSHLAGHTTQGAIDLSELLLIQASGPARPFPFLQSSQTLGFKSTYPILDRSRRVT